MVTFRQVIVTNFMISMFSSKFHEKMRIFFHGHFCAFHGWKFSFLSRPPFSVFTGEIWRKISRGLLSFHGQFLRHFHGKVQIFTGGIPKNFTGKKKTGGGEILKYFQKREFSVGKKKTAY